MTTNNELNNSSTGIQSLNTSGVFNGRALAGTSNQIAISNGDGISGNPTYSLTSPIQVSGISFDSGSNTLSDYQTGTFSPTLTAATPPTVTYAANGQIGNYLKLGIMVTVNLYMQLASFSGGASACRIAGLPFTVAAAISSDGPCIIENTSAGTANYCQLIPIANQTYSNIRSIKSASALGTIGVTNFTATSIVSAAASYNV